MSTAAPQGREAEPHAHSATGALRGGGAPLDAALHAARRRPAGLLTLIRFLSRISASLIFFPLVFVGQVTLGPEITLFPFHMVPVAQLAWEFGRKGAILGAALAVVLWIVGSEVGAWEFSAEWIRYYNALVRGGVYLLAGVFFVLFRRTLESHRMRVEAMRSLVDVCHGCGAVRGSDGVWVSMDELDTFVATRERREECLGCTRAAPPA